ncbi:MAG: hypothetical protein GY807_17330 [Gammaproteobacteria bacterium]|nr:hypothetical protein [Gammaproteobacteria bacterium]
MGLNQLVKGIWLGLLIAAYPVILYLLMSYQLAWLGALLVFGMIVWKLHRQNNWQWWTIILLVSTLVSARVFGIDAILKLSPLLIHISLFTFFMQSLYNVPMIERFARLEFDGKLPPGIATYCRKLTILWTVFFAANIAACGWLAILGDDASWVLYNGLIVYLLIGALLLGEYLWRQIAFPDLEIPPLTQTIRSIINNGHQVWGRGKNDGA